MRYSTDGIAMRNPRMIVSSSLIGFATAMLMSCVQVPSQQPISASEPTPQQTCESPTQERTYIETCASLTSREADTPLRDIPSSTQVMNRTLIDDQKALRVGDALRNVSGVQGGR